MPCCYAEYVPRPVKVLRGIPNHDAYRWKLRAKWARKGYSVRFA